MSLISLPPELQLIIASELSVCDLLHFLSTTHYFYSLLFHLFLKAAVEPKGKPLVPALIWATRRGYEPLVRLLLSNDLPERYKTDVDIIDDSKGKHQTALHIAAEHGHESIVRVLLEKGANVDARNSTCLTPLYCAAQCRSTTPGVIRTLLENAASLQHPGGAGNTVLHDAATYGRADVVRVLVEELGIDVDIRDQFGKTPLMVCLSNDYRGLEDSETMAITLLELGADPRQRSRISLLDKAHSKSAENLIATLLQKLLPLISPSRNYSLTDKEEHWNTVQNDGQIALWWAAYLGDIKMVQYLLSAEFSLIPSETRPRNRTLRAQCSPNRVPMLSYWPGISVNQSINGTNALHRASTVGNVDIIHLLLDAHAMVDARDDTGWTPLHFAAKGLHNNAVAALLRRGADVNAKNDCGITALHWAVQNAGEDAVSLVDLLMVNGADVGAGEGEDTVLKWALNPGGDERVVDERVVERLLHWGIFCEMIHVS